MAGQHTSTHVQSARMAMCGMVVALSAVLMLTSSILPIMTYVAPLMCGILLIPIFVIIALGIVLGSIPIPVGMKASVKLGLAGGPLVVALVAGWLGVKKGWYGTDFTDGQGVHMLREVGIALFLAGVGLSAGGQFVETVQSHYIWVVYGVIITMVPPLLVAGFGRLVLKMNWYTLAGFIGGSHTDPPTLAFANTVAPEGCKLPNIGYATVYPLTMFLRIFTAQLIVLMA